MNYKVIVFMLGWILQIEGVLMLLPVVVGLTQRENAAVVYLVTAIVCFGIGKLLSLKKGEGQLYLKEGYFVVALSWIVMSAFGAIPFVVLGEIPNYFNALFETVSGFTTTGSSILTDLTVLSEASLFWRSFTHWIGGMGVFVFIVALLPLLGGSNMNLVKAESTGPSVGKLVPRAMDTAKILYGIYITITVIEALLLMLHGLPVLVAFELTFGTVGTGGFGVLGDSIASYRPAVQWIIAIFMMLSGVNYSMYFLLLRRKFKEAFTMEEVCWYAGGMLSATVLIAINVRSFFETWEETFRHSFFQVSSIMTSTGFATYDFDIWPTFSKVLLLALMFVGACAGSTGGGVKVSRVMIVWKAIKKEISILIHPRAIKKIKIDGNVVPHEVVRATTAYISAFCLILISSVILISLDGFDFETSFSAVLANLNNIGPGIGKVGPTGNYSEFSEFSKVILIFDMLAGRLELFPMLLLITPRSWRKSV